MTDIVKYDTDSGVSIELAPKTVRDYLVSGEGKVSDQEVVMFMELCKAQKLNPFLREAYLVKYGNKPAQIVTGKETFTKRAERHEAFDGFEAGVTVATADGLIRREGSMVGGQTERLVGGWARVYRKDRAHAFFEEVALSEYSTGQSTWNKMPGTMIRKVAIVHAFREAFPETFSGLYSPEEMNNVESDSLPEAPVEPDEPMLEAEVVVLVDDATLATLRDLRAQAGVNDDTYGQQLEAVCQVSSDTDLSQEGAEMLISAYKTRIPKPLEDEDIPF